MILGWNIGHTIWYSGVSDCSCSTALAQRSAKVKPINAEDPFQIQQPERIVEILFILFYYF